MNKFNKELGLKDKAIINFDGLHFFNFSDIDGISINEKTIIIIEEKFRWNGENTFFQNKLLEKINVPTLLIKTKNPKDISNKDEKIINLKDSIVVDYITNDDLFYCFWNRKVKGLIRPDYFRGKNVNELIDVWKEYIYGTKTEYWMKKLNNRTAIDSADERIKSDVIIDNRIIDEKVRG